MDKKYTEIKPDNTIWDYSNLFQVLKSKNITFYQMQKDLQLSEEEKHKIQKGELINLTQISKYLDVSIDKLYNAKGIYALINDWDVAKNVMNYF